MHGQDVHVPRSKNAPKKDNLKGLRSTTTVYTCIPAMLQRWHRVVGCEVSSQEKEQGARLPAAGGFTKTAKAETAAKADETKAAQAELKERQNTNFVRFSSRQRNFTTMYTSRPLPVLVHHRQAGLGPSCAWPVNQRSLFAASRDWL